MAATIKSHFEEITECSVCACIYADPRTLPCLHTFCLKCIEAWARNRTDAGEKVECPICRKDFSVPDGGGVGDLPKNFAMNNLVELLRDFPDTASASVEVSDQPCQLCSRVADSASGADVAVAASHCTECCIEICAACAEEHMTESCHEVVSRLSKGYSRRNTDHSNVKVFSNYCDRHSKKLLKFYCFDCKSTICASCITANGADDLHAGHKFCDVGKAAYQFRQQMASDLNCMAEGIDICYRLLEHLADDRDSFLERVTEIEMDIHETADRLTKEIARQKVELLTELTAVKERKLSEVEIVFQSIEGLRVMIENYKKFTEDLSAYGTPVEIAQKADYVHSKLDEHLKFDDILCDFNNWGSVDVALEKSELAENSSSFQLAKMNVIKQVGFDVADFKTISTRLVHATPSDKPVGGLAILGNELFVARKGNVQQIEVYDRSTLNFRHHLTVPGLGKIPYDLASCAINKCLYVINRCLVLDDVIRVGLSDDAGNGGGTTAVSKWPNVGFNAQGLFVRNSGNVLVTCYSSVVEFTTDGVVVREIVRQTGPMTFLYHCVQLNDDGPFVVCGGRQHRVSQLAIVGDGHCEVRCSYDGHCDITAGPLDEPGHMAIDRNGWIVVADRNNNRLVAMNPSLSCARQVPVVVDVDGGGLRGPWTVCFDESRNRLYVGERDAGRVLAFDYVNDVRFLRFAS